MAETVKIMISLPRALLEQVDKAAAERAMSRSAFVRNALRHRLVNKPDLERRRRATEQLRERLGRWPFDESPEELIRAERDKRTPGGRS